MAALPLPNMTPAILPGALPMVDGMTPMQVDGTWMGLGEQATPGIRCALLSILLIWGYTYRRS